MKHLIASLLLAGTAATAFADNPVVELRTSEGPIVIELYEDKAPKTVSNFVSYVEQGFYDGTIFHRVIDGFMIQGGGFDTRMQQKKAGAPIENEANNGLRNEVGTIAMARTPNPHSATAQFFINVADNEFLNYRSPDMQGWGYAVFGRVIEGMDVVGKIAKTATGNASGHQNVPLQPIVIEAATLRAATPAGTTPQSN